MGSSYRIDVRVEGYGWWHLIENPQHFLRRWKKALRRNRFFPVRYAGSRFLVNPQAIIMVVYT